MISHPLNERSENNGEFILTDTALQRMKELAEAFSKSDLRMAMGHMLARLASRYPKPRVVTPESAPAASFNLGAREVLESLDSEDLGVSAFIQEALAERERERANAPED